MPTFTAYHATLRRFEKPTDFLNMRGIDYGPGFYLACDLRDTSTYGQVVYKAKVVLDRPVIVSKLRYDQNIGEKLRKALRIKDEDLSFYDSRMAGIFDLAKVLIEMGSVSRESIIRFIKSHGYDGICVEPSVTGKGAYIVIFSPTQILSWDLVPTGSSTVRR
jgi:hypothetical protein